MKTTLTLLICGCACAALAIAGDAAHSDADDNYALADQELNEVYQAALQKIREAGCTAAMT
jgi:uncharacterized protein YecT (DUF1311 family)